MQEYCQCVLSLDVVDQAIVQCFPENMEKINVLLLMHSTPSLNLSEISMYMHNWIESDPVIMINETSLKIDDDCNIEIIQGPECVGNTSPTTASTEPMTVTTVTDGTSDSSGGGSGTDQPSSDDTTTTNPDTTGSLSQGPNYISTTLIVVAVIIMSLAVALTLFIVMRNRIAKCDM